MEARIAKAFRVRGPRARAWYVRARRAARFFHDRDRRAVLAALPPPAFQIPLAHGYLVLPPATFEETRTIITDAADWLRAFQSSEPSFGKKRKRFLQNVLDSSTLTRESAVVRLALRDDLLVAVARYLGVVPLLSTISAFLSADSDPAHQSSQLYHCDGDDVRQVKVFIYCSDVNMTSGPLTVLDAESTAAVMDATRYQFRRRLADEQVHAVVGTGKERVIVGPAGTTALVDTSRCLHFGSRVDRNAIPRLVVMIQYQTPYSFMPPEGSRSFRHLADDDLPELQRLVLGV